MTFYLFETNLLSVLSMLPRIKKAELGKVHINEEVLTDDFLLHANGVERIEKNNRISTQELERMLLHDPDAAVFGIGFNGKAKIDQSVFNAAKKSNIDVHVLKTPDALKKFQELARKGSKVVAHIHVGE